jgi:hypothetical protein
MERRSVTGTELMQKLVVGYTEPGGGKLKMVNGGFETELRTSTSQH